MLDSPSSPAATPPARWSTWALAALPTSLVLCAPVTATGALLAVIGLVQIRRSGGVLRGRRAAQAAIAVAIVGLAIQGVLLSWWHRHVRTPMLEGPRAALRAGLGGDVEAFRAAFTEPADVADTAAFLDAVAARWGDLLAISPDPFAPPPEAPAPAALPSVPYRFTFTRGETVGEASFRTFAPSSGVPKPVLRWEHLVLRDEDGPELEYPPSTRPAGTPP